MDDEQKDMYQKALRLRLQAQQFLSNDFFKQGFYIFAQSTVIKFPRIWQSLFYLLALDKEQLCEPETNKLKWKHAKAQLEPKARLLQKILEYEAQGPKSEVYADYQTINFVEKNLDGLHQEDVDSYSSAIMGRLLKWLLGAVKLRKQDVTRRISLQKRAKDAREEAILKEDKRKERMTADVKEAEARFLDDHRDEIDAAHAYANRDQNDDEDAEKEKEQPPVMPVFNKEEFLAKWLLENPQVEIPEEVKDDVDNDWVLSPSETEYLISTYFNKE
jgi:hypothetical protein